MHLVNFLGFRIALIIGFSPTNPPTIRNCNGVHQTTILVCFFLTRSLSGNYSKSGNQFIHPCLWLVVSPGPVCLLYIVVLECGWRLSACSIALESECRIEMWSTIGLRRLCHFNRILHLFLYISYNVCVENVCW